MTAYDRLLELAVTEHGLVVEGRYELLPELARERAELVATLPARPPREAFGILERCGDLHARTTSAMQAAAQSMARELTALQRGRGAVRGYAGPGAQARPAGADYSA